MRNVKRKARKRKLLVFELNIDCATSYFLKGVACNGGWYKCNRIKPFKLERKPRVISIHEFLVGIFELLDLFVMVIPVFYSWCT